MADNRAILHVDMDAFFASVEQRDDPTLAGKPVLVGGTGLRAVVAAASYEARVFGCHSAMPMVVARRLCPQAIIVKPKGGRYGEVSREIFEILARFTPMVQPISVDEAFLDVTGSKRLLGDAVTIAREIKRVVRAETQLTASIGVAPNKLVAKIASDLDKPDGLTVIRAGEVQTRLAPLSIERLWGVGPRSADRLGKLGVHTFGDMQRLGHEALDAVFGSSAESMWNRCRGIDDRPVHADHGAKSISHETTFGTDLESADAVRAVLLDQAEQVARRLRAKGRRGRTISIKIRFGRFETITRSVTLEQATDRTDEIARQARRLFDAWAFEPVRLIGVGVSELTQSTEEQLGLFSVVQSAQQRAIDRASDTIIERFGKDAIRRGGTLS
ncbi:MAG: DNA polymerase IV [Planctomycetes bacterium]|nr:DNA polymerase IV [Planctomycetota bacterium]